MPNPFRRLTSFFQDRVKSFTTTVSNTFSVVTGRRQEPLPEDEPLPEESPAGFVGFIKSIVSSPFTKELSHTAAQKSATLTENAVFAGSMLVGHLVLGPVGAIGLGVGVNFLQNRNQGRRQTLGKTAFTAVGIGTGAIAGAGLGAALGLPLGPVGVVIGSGIGSAGGGLIGRTFGHRLYSSATNIFAAARNPLSPNSFVTITSNLTSILLLPITIPFDLFIKPLLVGCLVLVALVLFAIFLIFALFIIPNPQTTGSPKDGSIIPPSELVVSGTCPLLESPVISCGSLGSGGNSCEHGGVGYGNVCYGVPIRGMWVWDDQPANDPNRLRCADKDGNLQEPGYCNGTSCPYFGYATDVESSTPNPTIRLPYICSETQNSSTCGPMTWTVVDTFYNCRGGSTNTKEECEAKEFVDNNGNLLPKENQLWGWGTIFESDDNGHHWKLYLNHYENTVPVGRGSTFTADSQQSSTIGIIPEGAYVDHLHYELVVDGTPVRPDYLCQ